jgi:hypothetical protein
MPRNAARPTECRLQHAAERRRDHRRERRDRAHAGKLAAGADAVVEIAHHRAREHRRRGHAQRLQAAQRDQHLDRGREYAAQTHRDIERERRNQHRLAADVVGDGSVHDLPDGETEQVAGQRQLHLCRRRAEHPADLGQRRQVEVDRHRADRGQERQQRGQRQGIGTKHCPLVRARWRKNLRGNSNDGSAARARGGCTMLMHVMLMDPTTAPRTRRSPCSASAFLAIKPRDSQRYRIPAPSRLVSLTPVWKIGYHDHQLLNTTRWPRSRTIWQRKCRRQAFHSTAHDVLLAGASADFARAYARVRRSTVMKPKRLTAIALKILLIALVAALFFGAQAQAQLARQEFHALQSVTLSDAAFLNDKKDGVPVTLAGALRLPTLGSEKLPAVILLHGSGGVGGSGGSVDA